MTEKTEKVTIKLPNMELSIQLLSFKQEANKEYILLDTGCILYLLRRLPSLVHRFEKDAVKLAIIEHTIYEVAEHLSESFKAKIRKRASPFGVYSGIENFRKLLRDDRVKKFTNPKMTKKDQLVYKRFGEDMLLAYAFFEGGFRAIATQDTPLIEKISKKYLFPCQQLLKD